MLLYGLYSKISNPQNVSRAEISNYSLNLDYKESITDVKIINRNKILAIISNGDELFFIVYDLKQNKIVSKIGR